MDIVISDCADGWTNIRIFAPKRGRPGRRTKTVYHLGWNAEQRRFAATADRSRFEQDHPELVAEVISRLDGKHASAYGCAPF